MRFLAVWLFSVPVFAQGLGPEELVRKVTAEVMDAIKSDQELAAGDKQKVLKLAEEKVLPHVDFEEATRLAVGRGWAQATPEQKKRLTAEFRNMLVRTYANAIGAYQGQQMKVLPVRMKPGDTEVTVHNRFTRPGNPNPVLVDYAMRKTDQGWKIYDIVVEGVSLVLTYRSEFDALVKQQGIDGLIRRLSQKNTPA
ncbi:MAG: MlaC/ttg2D family ABC transporter substrate-binding protein [Burkholderiales bacterium]